MKVKVKIDGQFFIVEVGNLSERPITAVVDGEEYEVWPENNMAYPPSTSLPKKNKEPANIVSGAIPSTAKTQEILPATLADGKKESTTSIRKVITAPIPGVITAILVQAGSEVVVGQELCKLEAMKMNNSIRASRSGKVGSVMVSIGQHVKHNDVLIEFTE